MLSTVRTRRMLCVHIPPTCAQHGTISIHVVWCPWCGDVLCMLTHCPCCAAHTTTYACTYTIMLQRPSPMVGAVVLLCDTTLHAQLLYVYAACSVYTYHQHVLRPIPSPTALVAARGDVSDVAPHDALLLYGCGHVLCTTYHQHVICTDIPLTVHVAHPYGVSDNAPHSMYYAYGLHPLTPTTSCRGRYHRADPCITSAYGVWYLCAYAAPPRTCC